MIFLTKQELRRAVLEQIKSQKEEDFLAGSRCILERLINLKVFRQANTVLFYASCRGEVDTWQMMNRAWGMNKRVAVPKVQIESKMIVPVAVRSSGDLRPGAYGILEPEYHSDNAVSPGSLDLVIVPGVAFDRRHHRLGRGAGYYDRFLAGLSSSTPTLGLAFDFQIVETIPEIGPHDRAVHEVLTDA